MAATKATKNLARQLYQEGHNALFISERCGVNRRTAQRWVKVFEEEKVIVHGEENLADPGTPSVDSLPALEAVANAEPIGVELTMTSRTAIRLLNLAESAVAAVEKVLNDDSSASSARLRAAQIAGEWLGFRDSNGSIFEKVSSKLELESTLQSSQSDEITFNSQMKTRAMEREKKAQNARTRITKPGNQEKWDINEKLAKKYRSPEDIILLSYESELDWMYFLSCLAILQGYDVASDLAEELIRSKYLSREEVNIFIDVYSETA